MAETWGMVGHGWAVELLRNQVGKHAARQAYVITGPRGIGRRTLAQRFAQALMCSQPVDAGIPCGDCDNCRRLLSGRHPDLMMVQAEEVGGTLKVEQVREARRSLQLKPYQSGTRVAIFLRFQEANDAAANALLKILEEAPSYAVLILTAESAEGLLPTITSRCEILRLQPLRFAEIESMLKQRGANLEQARLISHVSAGCPGIALDMLTHPDVLQRREQKLAELMSLLRASRAKKFAYAAEFGKDKAALREAVLLWLSVWRDVLWRSSGAATPIANIDRESEIEALANTVDFAEARRIVSDLDRALRRLETNVNSKLLAEVLLLDLPAPAAVESSGSL